MRALLAISVILGCCLSAQAATVLVDFSSAQSTPPGPQGGNYWNTIGTTAVTSLLDSATGLGSGWDIKVDDGGTATGFGGTGINGNGAAAPFDQTFAIVDGIFSNRANAAGTSTITFTGLAGNTPYGFSTYSDRASGWANSVIATTVGTGPASVALLKDSVTDFTVTSSGSGSIAFTFAEGPGESSPVGNNSVLNALSMTGAPGPGYARIPFVNNSGNGANLVTVPGGDLNKPDVSSTTTGLIGSNASDNNTWGTGSTSTATGPDIVTNGSTWRFAALTKVGAILNASSSDALVSPADLNQPLAISLTLAGQAAGPNTSVGYAPLAYLYGIDTGASGASGWWGSANKTTLAVSSSTPLTTGVWDATTGTWTFDFLTDGLLTADTGDLLGIAIVGNEDAVANEWLRYNESFDSFLAVQLAPAPSVIPEPATMCALGLALAAIGRYVKKRRRA